MACYTLGALTFQPKIPALQNMQDYIFEIQLKVRDYECDIQGIVNNAIYQSYLEHARHEYLQSKNISFKKLTEEGILLMVSRIEMDFKRSLTSGIPFL